MRSRLIWGLFAALLAGAGTSGYFAHRRQAQIDYLSAECSDTFKRKDWRSLEQKSQAWLAVQAAPVPWYWLGTALKEQGKFFEADEAFAQVPREGLRGLDAAAERMEILFHVRRRPLEAVQQARELLEIDPKLASPRRHLIYFHAMMLQRVELLREIRAAIQHRVDLPEHYAYLVILEDLAFSDAEAVTQQWQQQYPQSAELELAHDVQLVRNARLEARTTPSPERLSRYEFLQEEICPRLAQQQAPLAIETLLLLAVDRTDVDEVARLLALVPDDATEDAAFWRYRGWYATQVKDYSQAEDSYREGMRLDPLGPHIRHEYSNLLRLAGRVDEAAKVQTVAAVGSKLMEDTRLLPHMNKVDPKWLRRLAGYADLCQENEIRNGILRRFTDEGKQIP